MDALKAFGPVAPLIAAYVGKEKTPRRISRIREFRIRRRKQKFYTSHLVQRNWK